MIGGNLYLRRLTLSTAERLVDHNFTVGQHKAFALCARGKQERTH